MATRRGFMTAMAAGAGATLAVGPAAAQSGVDLTDWLSDVDNAGSVVDRTGTSETTVAVGADGNGGAFGFGPPVVRVDPGTTVTFEWTGGGGSHNVVADDGSFESPMQGSEGATFAHTFESAGVTRYYCSPHETMGMKGVVVVGDAQVTLPGGATPTPTATETETAEPRSFDGWLANTDNYDGVVDRRGEEEVVVEVGAEGNGGPLAFEPAAVRVSSGTTVKWEWVGPRRYDVVDPDLGYGSEQVTGEGYGYAVEFSENGLSKYECTKYGDQGMRGVVVVGDGPRETLSWQGVGAAGLLGSLLAVPLAAGVRLHAKTTTRAGKNFGRGDE
ncbi:halocyanin domain-containing protein [Halosegnis marinus]|uniref:Halocyanin domain-containing protein n=1 Tax=Halosegnis marinus TaxID=3034023 RepID=A0ABD5ZN40_9EURY|nr:halocyanin domain-containing protein [Halosegnis sp. DT85]